MKNLFTVLILIVLIDLTPSFGQNISVESGNVWTGDAFVVKDIYISNGKIISYKPVKIDHKIDASGQYILPAFGDYHTHNFTYNNVEFVDSAFLAQGLFYAQDLANDPIGRLQNRSYLNQKNTINVKFANGIITSSQGHPVAGYERQALGVGFPRTDEERQRIANSEIMRGRAYHILDYEEQIDSVMNILLASQPDVIKIVLWDSENYVEEDPTANKGINPEFIPEIVRLASLYDLPVVAHIETEYDFKIALEAGVKHFAHSPLTSYGNDGEIAENFPVLSSEIKTILAANKDVVINPTLLRTSLNIRYLPKSQPVSDDQKKLIKDFHRQLLLDLKDSGVKLAMGADFPGLTAIDEAFYYSELGAFSNAQLINLLINSASLIYKESKIGKIESAYKANLIIVDENPAKNLEALRTIKLHIKEGNILEF